MTRQELGRGWAGGGAAKAAYELRPLSLGEVLDRTFALYRSRVWLFAALGPLAATIQSAMQAVSLGAVRTFGRQIAIMKQTQAESPAAAIAGLHGLAALQISGWVGGLLFFLVSAVVHAAIALALSQIYLGKDTSARASLRAVLPRWGRWIAIALWQVGSFVWLPLAAVVPGMLFSVFGVRHGYVLPVVGGLLVAVGLLAGMPAGIVLYLRNGLAVPAAVMEGLPTRAAMKRSKVLAAGAKGRIFVVWLITFCLYTVVSALQTPATFLVMLAPDQGHYLLQGIALLATFAGGAVVAPVALIGVTLVYLDQRVRKEAFDLELLLARSAAPGATGEFGLPGTLGAAGALPGSEQAQVG